MVFAQWMNQIKKNQGKLYIIGKSSNFQTKYSNNFLFGAPGAQIGPLDLMGRPLRFFLNFVYTVYMAIGKIWLKEPHRQIAQVPLALRAHRNS